jgi:hypothetical protein
MPKMKAPPPWRATGPLTARPGTRGRPEPRGNATVRSLMTGQPSSAAAVERGACYDARGQKAIYRLRSFGSDRKMIGIQRFSAINDDEAMATAKTVAKSAPTVTAFDLWEGDRHVTGAAPTIRAPLRPRNKPRR